MEKIASINPDEVCVIRFLHLMDTQLEIEGTIPCTSETDEPEVLLHYGEKQYVCERLPWRFARQWEDERIQKEVAFRGRIPYGDLEESGEISVDRRTGDSSVVRQSLSLEKFTPLNSSLQSSFYADKGWILSYHEGKSCLVMERENRALLRRYRRRMVWEMFTARDMASKKSLLARLIVRRMKKRRNGRPIWLISDRINRADDNGEVFIAFLSGHPEVCKDRDIYFVVEKNCPDAERLRQYGPLIEPMSWKHKIYHLLSEYIISSQANDPVVNPFRGCRKYYRDLLQEEKIVFLQHGVTKDNQSEWLSRYNRNLHGLIVSTMPEYESIFTYDYAYDKERVWLTGMPRFDRLYEDSKKYITIMPTWRKSLTSGIDAETSLWLLDEGFEQSEYFQFYDCLLNHEGLLCAAKEHGYTVCFMPHPSLAPYADAYFHKHEGVIFWEADKPYREIFAETDLLVTDYSSVAFDFAYLRKPILYCQFDREEFFSGSHTYTEGYFDYERDGFGEITTDLESTVRMIQAYMENGCVLKENYRDRIDKTFAFGDANNAQRVLERLIGNECAVPDGR